MPEVQIRSSGRRKRRVRTSRSNKILHLTALLCSPTPCHRHEHAVWPLRKQSINQSCITTQRSRRLLRSPSRPHRARHFRLSANPGSPPARQRTFGLQVQYGTHQGVSVRLWTPGFCPRCNTGLHQGYAGTQRTTHPPRPPPRVISTLFPPSILTTLPLTSRNKAKTTSTVAHATHTAPGQPLAT